LAVCAKRSYSAKFAFPISVAIADSGEVVTVNDEEEFAALAQYCE
jgi:hypothetical protein